MNQQKDFTGYIQNYTGDGKGKTTAALGLAVRAASAGYKVFIGQFVKGQEYSELKIPDYISNITINQFGTENFIFNKPSLLDKQKAAEGWQKIKKSIKEKEYDIYILDELNVALFYNLLNIDDIVHFLINKPGNIEIIVTGRHAPEELLKISDLITEMHQVKHYYTKNVPARKGIEY